ncbi:hypothetical protein OZX62_07515 [Bifidobacterium sp. ESL0690]|uniref:hypothetical protein n=1 Tax=Bifidobacterium sp. ESL0690 TaxID=2983214 RepID=UPI0023F8303F|nr:hypothetical protein [Bifidobacterium sp. ESL0690]WEV46286.1 hypothetical protein OZX62_07515 [Bifidobacterium sp. ESL0690]
MTVTVFKFGLPGKEIAPSTGETLETWYPWAAKAESTVTVILGYFLFAQIRNGAFCGSWLFASLLHQFPEQYASGDVSKLP